MTSFAQYSSVTAVSTAASRSHCSIGVGVEDTRVKCGGLQAAGPSS